MAPPCAARLRLRLTGPARPGMIMNNSIPILRARILAFPIRGQ